MLDAQQRAELGRKGEAVAAKFYLNQGYVLQAHNYRTRMGELDLVLRKGTTLVICEVKSRDAQSFAKTRPAERVTYHKQKRIVFATKRYLQETHQSDCHVRFDVAEVTHMPDSNWQVHCMRSAFET